MDIEKLIEDLRIACAGNQHNIMGVAATALSTLQDENAQLRESRDHWKRLAHELSEGVNGKDAEHERLQAENEKLRAELEKVKAENATLSASMLTIQKSDNLERMEVVYKMDYATALSQRQLCDVAWIVFRGLLQEDLKWRGPQKED